MQARLSIDQGGVDLGLKDVAARSDGVKLENGRFYRDLENKLPPRGLAASAE